MLFQRKTKHPKRTRTCPLSITDHSIRVAGEQVPITLRKSRATKHVRLIVRPGGAVTLSSPLRMSNARLFAFLESKASWLIEKRRFMQGIEGEHLYGTPEEFARFKEAALALAQSRLAHWNRLYGFSWNRVSIRNQKTRWGSCSRQGHLSFSYRIALLPPEQADYIIVHELCHLGEFNHSPRFWQLVARALPDYRRSRQALKAG